MPFASAVELLEIFESGTTITIPGGFNVVEIWAIGAGGSGRRAGGGAGGVAYKEYPVLAAEEGTTLTIAVGTGASDANGGNTTVNGTLNGAAITELKGFGGVKGGLGTGGAGGTASGGSTNSDGAIGTDYDAEGPTYGIGGAITVETPLNITSASTFGGGGGGQASGFVAGQPGLVICRWRQ